MHDRAAGAPEGRHGLSYENENGAPQLTFAEIGEATAVYEYSVLVTSKNDWFLRRGLNYVRAYPGEARPER